MGRYFLIFLSVGRPCYKEIRYSEVFCNSPAPVIGTRLCPRHISLRSNPSTITITANRAARGLLLAGWDTGHKAFLWVDLPLWDKYYLSSSCCSQDCGGAGSRFCPLLIAGFLTDLFDNFGCVLDDEKNYTSQALPTFCPKTHLQS